MESEGLIRKRQAAVLVGCSADSIARWARSGVLRCWRTPGGHMRFRRQDVERVLRGRRQPVGDKEARRVGGQ